MADKKISALTAATTPLSGTEVLPIVQSGATVKVSVDNLTTGKAVTVGSLTDSGNLTFTGTGNRILGDLTNATIASRVMFQNSVTNGSTVLNALPNGTSVASGFAAYGNSDPANTSIARIVHIVGEASVQSTISGTGTYLPLTFHTGGVKNAELSTTGNFILSTGNLVIGTSGKGIDFSATPGTGTSELLADYEEGTWTPTGNGVTYTGVTGTYTKIGNIVTVFYAVTVPVTADTEQARLGGLPFTSTNTTGVASPGAADLSLLVDGNTFARFANLAVSAYKTNVNLSGLTLTGQITYHA